MTAYNFKKQFCDDVESGKKAQTIRACRKDGRVPEVGDTLQLYTGMRTKQCRKLRDDAICISVSHINISEYGIKLNGRWLYPREADELAIADGFKRWVDLIRFFEDVHGLPFDGVLIKWV